MIADMSAGAEAIDALAHRLRPHYRNFLEHRSDEVLMTAHSHQAWPDVAREGQLEAYEDAARSVDEKWTRVFSEILPDFRRRVAQRIGSRSPGRLALAPNTHELVERLLSCFPPTARVVTTDAEFHSMRRQLARSAEDGLQVRVVTVDDKSDAELTDALVSAVDEAPTALVGLSHVFFHRARVHTELPRLTAALAERKVHVLVDVYHSFNVLEVDCDAWHGAFVVGGGYKYAQGGEGNCWMHVPPAADALRPRYTGWFADFAHLEEATGQVRYGPEGDRFLGSTFDPTPFYRARKVLEWMDAQELSVSMLAEAARRSTGRIVQAYDRLEMEARGLELASPRDPERRGGFVAFEREDAVPLQRELRQRGIRTDVRGRLLRFGPAPYTTASEIDRAMQALSEIL